MPSDDIAPLIRRLHDALAAAPALDDEARRELHNLAADLDRLATIQPGEEHAGLTARLRKGVERFEVTHPHLARSLANLIDAMALYGL